MRPPTWPVAVSSRNVAPAPASANVTFPNTEPPLPSTLPFITKPGLRDSELPNPANLMAVPPMPAMVPEVVTLTLLGVRTMPAEPEIDPVLVMPPAKVETPTYNAGAFVAAITPLLVMAPANCDATTSRAVKGDLIVPLLLMP